jgi:hypothetical protein
VVAARHLYQTWTPCLISTMPRTKIELSQTSVLLRVTNRDREGFKPG